MGRHERHKAEISEYLISKALQHEGNVLSKMIDEDYIELSSKIVDAIGKEYEVTDIQKVGNSYDSIGDIMIESTSGKIYAEIKITESGGTLGNISQDALTKYGIVEEALSWSEFRSEKDHYGWVREYLDRFEFPSDVRDDDTKTSIYKKASHLKKEIDCGRQKTEKVAREVLRTSNDRKAKNAAQIIVDIIEKSNKQRKEYIEYISKQKINKDKLRNFTYLLLSGYATEDDIRERINMSIEDLNNHDEYQYVVYNGYKNKMKVEKEDKSERVELLLGEQTVDIDFPEGQSGFNIIIGNQAVLRGQFHWKNKFQGVQTPCINIFHTQ